MESTEHVAISADLQTNVDYVSELIGIGTSWDVMAKPFNFENVSMMSFVTNGFFMTTHMLLLLENFEKTMHTFVTGVKSQESFTLQELIDYLNTHIPFVQVQKVKKMSDAVRFILSGPLVTFIEGCDEALLIDTRVYPMRSISESEVERVVRGPRDGFTETMLMNCALVRRRLRDPRLRVELFQVGTRSQTDVSLMYLQDVTNDALVEDLRTKIKSIYADALPMSEQPMTELIGKVKWNPYPIVRYTERPDVAATALIEGQAVIIVDTSPEVIIAPTTFFQHMQHPQEYHSYPLVGTYMRWVILFAVLSSVLLPGIFLMLNAHPGLTPAALVFFRADRSDPLPLWAEIIIAEVALDILRLAVINTPVALASSVSIIAALLFGQFATKIQLLQPAVLVYMGYVLIAQLATSSYELGSANQIARFWIIGWTATLGRLGFAISLVSWFVLLLCTRSFGVPYLWPLIPFQWRNGLSDVIFRKPFHHITGRPGALRPKTLRRKG